MTDLFKRNVVIIVLLFLASQAFAGLTVSPARQEISLVPGGTYQGSFTVRNDYDVPTSIKTDFRNWFALPENKDINISDWLSVTPSEVFLNPGESKDVNYTVRLSTVAQGVSVAMVSFIPEVSSEQGVTMVVSVSLFVTAAGTEKVNWDIGDVTFGTSSSFSVSAAIRNNGNVHLRPQGNIQVLSGGNAIAGLDFAAGRPVYPGASRSLVASTDKPVQLPAGKYTAIVLVKAAGQEKIKKMNIVVSKTGEVAIR